MITASSPAPVSGLNTPLHLLLTRLAVAFGRRRAYPASHPQVRTAEAQAYEALQSALSEQSQVTFSIAKDDLLVDGLPVTSVGDLAREFSGRLRARGVGTLAFDRTVSASAFSEAIGWLATEPRGEDQDAATESPPEQRGVTMTRIAYGRLALLGDEAPGDVADDLWRALATASLFEDDMTVSLDHDGPEGESPSGVASGLVESSSAAGIADGGDSDAIKNGRRARVDGARPEEIAAAIERRLEQADFSRRVGFLLLQMTEHAARSDATQPAQLGQRLQSLVGHLHRSSVGAIIKSIGSGAEQRRLVGQVIEALPAESTVAWLEAAATVSGETLSPHILRLLAKLGAHTATGARTSGSVTAMSAAARQLVDAWSLDDPNPAQHTSLLDRIALSDRRAGGRTMSDEESSRAVLMALEIDEFGEDALEQARYLLGAGQVAELMRYADEAPGRTAAAALQELILSPASIRRVLLQEPPDLAAARLLLSTLDSRAIEPLLDVLGEAGNRTIRRLVYDRLREFGTALTPHLTPRLANGAWYVVRNLLALMHDVAASDQTNVDGNRMVLAAFQSHEQEQVRVESLRLLAADARTREMALRRALDDVSPRVLRVALDLLTSDERGDTRARHSPEIARRLLRLVESHAVDDDLLARVVRALADVASSAAVRDALLALVTRRTLVLRRVVIADPGPVVLAALDVLARRYARDAKTAPALKAAMEHQDAGIRMTVQRAARGGAAA